MEAPSSKRGFTLIELLVVIAIIGILSSVVLASLAIARLKAADATIKSDMSNMTTQIELYFDSNGSAYGTGVPLADGLSPRTSVPAGTTVFSSDANVKQMLQQALNQSGSMRMATGVGNNSYAVAVKLRADSTNWWCIDATNTPKTEPDASFGGGSPVLGGGSSAVARCP